jgi:hypothetical protein
MSGFGFGYSSFLSSAPSEPAPAPIGVFLSNQYTVADYGKTANMTLTNPTATSLRFELPVHTLNDCSTWYTPYLTGRDNFSHLVPYRINVHNAESWGFGPSVLNYNGSGSDYLSGMVGCATGFNDTTIYLWTGSGNLIDTSFGVLPTPNVGDLIRATLTINVNVYTLTVVNVTQGNATDSISYEEVYTSGVLETTRALAYYGFRTFGGDYTVDQADGGWNVSTTEYRRPTVLFVSNSKGVGAYCGNVVNKAIEIVKADNPGMQIVNNSGFNDTSARMMLKNAELLDYQADLVIFYDFTNNTRFAVPLTDVDTLISTHKANGSKVVFINGTAEGAGGVDATISNTAVAGKDWDATYDSYTPSQTAGTLKAEYDSGDHVHPNAAFNADILAVLIQQAIDEI